MSRILLLLFYLKNIILNNIYDNVNINNNKEKRVTFEMCGFFYFSLICDFFFYLKFNFLLIKTKKSEYLFCILFPCYFFSSFSLNLRIKNPTFPL